MPHLPALIRDIGSYVTPVRQRVLSAISVLRTGTVWQQSLLLAIAFISALMVRTFMIPHFTGDFTGFMLPWFEYLDVHGFDGLGDEFADYNVPYLYLLFVTTKLPIDAIEGVKLMGGFSISSWRSE